MTLKIREIYFSRNNQLVVWEMSMSVISLMWCYNLFLLKGKVCVVSLNHVISFANLCPYALYLVEVMITVMKHHDEKEAEDERICFTYTAISQFIIETGSRNSSNAGI